MPGHPAKNYHRECLLPVTLKLVLLITLSLSCTQALAGAWNYGAQAALNSNYSDNPTLADDDREAESLFSMVGTYKMDIEWSEPGRNFSIEPRVTRDYYPDSANSELESTDYFIPGNFSVYGNKSSFNMTFDYREQNILSSESAVLDILRREFDGWDRNTVKMLDVGAGYGRLSVEFGSLFSSVVLLEPDAERLSGARNALKVAGLGSSCTFLNVAGQD
jgi:hypothetical protein